MSILLLASVLLGLFVIAARGPLIFAPAETLQFYRQKPRIRTVAALMGAVGLSMFLSAQNVEGTFPSVAYYVGIVVALAMAFVVIAPGFIIRLLDPFPTWALRARGLAGVIVAVVWIYASFASLY